MQCMTNELLVKEIQEGRDQERKKLYELWDRNSGLIYKAVKRYSGFMEIDDLMQESFFALIKAINRYNPEKGDSFATYLFEWTRAHVGRYVSQNAGMIHASVHQQRKIWKYKQFCAEYSKQYGMEPPDSAVIAGMNITGAQLDQLKEDIQKTDRLIHIDAPIKNTEETITIADTIEDTANRIEDLTEAIFKEQRNRAVWKAVNALPADERDIIVFRYIYKKTYKQIAEYLKITAESVRTKEVRALRTLKRKNRKDLSQFWERSTIYNNGLKGAGVHAFRRTGTSATERTAIEDTEQWLLRFKKENGIE